MPKYGKMRQVNAVNGSQMVVNLRGSYYRRVKEKQWMIGWQLPVSNDLPYGLRILVCVID